jgi:hypothetical protein
MDVVSPLTDNLSDESDSIPTGSLASRKTSMAEERHMNYAGLEAVNLAKKDMRHETWDLRPAPAGGGAVEVYVAVELLKIGEVDPLRSTAQVQADVFLFWHDPRIRRLQEKKIDFLSKNVKRASAIRKDSRRISLTEIQEEQLPPDLWRPSFDLTNRCSDIPPEVFASPDYEAREIEIVDAHNGLLQLCIPIAGTIDNPMDLRKFPMDEDAIEFTLCGSLTRDGRPADASDFVLLPCSDGMSGGMNDNHPFMTFCFDRHLNEYEILGYNEIAYSKKKTHARREQHSSEWSYITFGIIVRRYFGYYFWKVTFLLWLVTGLAMASFAYGPCDFDARTETLNTMFLASAATLYVAGEKLPAVSFLTPIDRLIIATLLFLFSMQMEACYLKVLCNADMEEQAERVDTRFWITLVVLYVAINFSLFGPIWFAIVQRNYGPDPLITRVGEGATFVPYKDINKIDHSRGGNTIVGLAHNSVRSGSNAVTDPTATKARLIDVNGDGIADGIDFDGDGIIDATIQTINRGGAVPAGDAKVV